LKKKVREMNDKTAELCNQLTALFNEEIRAEYQTVTLSSTTTTAFGKKA
jgi:hypothetical protein